MQNWPAKTLSVYLNGVWGKNKKLIVEIQSIKFGLGV